MKWNDTTASKCRYGDIAGLIWGSWDILWEDSEEDYQGYADILAHKNGKYSFYEWSYGSCSGCDEWEGNNLSKKEIADEMVNTAMWFDDVQELKIWLGMLKSVATNTYYHRHDLIETLEKITGGNP